jgi:hypothetical protein
MNFSFSEIRHSLNRRLGISRRESEVTGTLKDDERRVAGRKSQKLSREESGSDKPSTTPKSEVWRGSLNFKRGALEGYTDKQLPDAASPSKGGLSIVRKDYTHRTKWVNGYFWANRFL